MADEPTSDQQPDGTRLDGLVAIVTGAGQGIGRAHAFALGRRGARVVVNDVGEGAEATVEGLAAEGIEATAARGSVSDWEASRSVVEHAVATYGDLHVLVNNAGFLRDRTVFNMTEEEFDAVVDVHLKGHFCMTRWATAYWRERSKATDGPVYARIVNTASESFLLGSAGQPNYGPAKAGIVTLTLSTAHACERYGVRANAICPRARTSMTEQSGWAQTQDQAFDRFHPDHPAALCAYLASPAAANVNRQVFLVWGGLVQVLETPTMAARFERDGAWTPEALAAELGPWVASREGRDYAWPG